MRALVIGCGSIGSRRSRILKSLGVELVLCDNDEGRALDLALALGYPKVEWFKYSYNALDSHPFDVALICTPPSSHLELALRCANHGINLFIEKPLAPSLDLPALEKLITTMRVQGVWGILGQSYRFLPSLREFGLKFIDQPVLAAEIWQGQHIGDWHPGDDYKLGYAAQPGEGGVVLDSFAHSLDIAQWLFSGIEAITALVAESGELGIPTDDVGTCLVRMKTGAQVTVHNDYWQRPRDFHITVVCAGPDDANTFHWTFDPTEVETMYRLEMEHLVKCVERRYQGQPDIFQGILNLEWMTSARAASERGTWERIANTWVRLMAGK